MQRRNILQTAIAITAVSAVFAFAGCGDDKTTSGAAAGSGATPATQSAGGSTGATAPVTAVTGTTGATATGGATGGATAGTYSSTVNAALARGYRACLIGAKKIPDAARRNQVTAQCNSSYRNAQQAAKNSAKAMKNASADCIKNAQAISNPKVRAEVLDNCERLAK